MIEKKNQKKAQLQVLSFFITYEDALSAGCAILSLNKAKFNKNKLGASYGQTRYCKNYLKNTKCKNRNCFYLHFDIDNNPNFYGG